jgi:phage host-nuclease inhibitor protein Gam
MKNIFEKVCKLKKAYKSIKQSIDREVDGFLSDLKDIFNDNFVYLTNLTTRKINETLKYKLQIQKMKLEIDDLKHKNLNLQFKLEQWE